MNHKTEKLTQKGNFFPFCLSDEEMQNPIEVFYSFCTGSNLRTEIHRLDRLLAAISRSGYEYNRLCYDLVDRDYRRLIEALFLFTDRKTIEEISLEMFLGLFAHEIKTQLAGASMTIEALINDGHSSSNPDFVYYLSCLKAILFNSDQTLSNMIKTVYFKDDYFALKPEVQSFEVANFIDECTMPYHVMNNTLNRNLIVEQSELQGKKIITDKIKLKQIVQNLLSNAYKHSKGKDIQLIVTCFAHYISFSVISFGDTIPQKEIEKLFRMFYKVKPGYAGDGIGLYLCKLYTEALDGNIKVRSNKGTTSFTVSIPFESGDANMY